MNKFAALLVLASALSACSSTGVTNTASPSYATIPAELTAKVAGVAVLESAPSAGQKLGTVRAQACQRLTSDPLPTPELAIALLKEQAMLKGGNAIAQPSVSSSTVSLSGNCWANITATAEAFTL
jgi:uncharacterized protein YbjQ (UPF0145 family)